ncbi:hypothetical protein LE977_25475, partial [Mycobacterium avium]|nr:hypothetical protein [Mycobacterium avium]
DATSRTEAGLFTWGGHGGITAPFYATYNTVAVVALTEELFTGGKSPEGVDFNRLATDLNLLNTGPVMSKAPRGKRRGEGPHAHPETFAPTGSTEVPGDDASA